MNSIINISRFGNLPNVPGAAAMKHVLRATPQSSIYYQADDKPKRQPRMAQKLASALLQTETRPQQPEPQGFDLLSGLKRTIFIKAL